MPHNFPCIYLFLLLQLRTPFNSILVNLSCADFLMMSIGIPLDVVAAINGGWCFSQTTCNAIGFIMTFTGMFYVMHSALKLEKKCNFKSAKKHSLHFQKSQKINFCIRKKPENCIFGSFELFSSAKMNFLPFLKMQRMLFCTFEIALFF